MRTPFLGDFVGGPWAWIAFALLLGGVTALLARRGGLGLRAQLVAGLGALGSGASLAAALAQGPSVPARAGGMPDPFALGALFVAAAAVIAARRARVVPQRIASAVAGALLALGLGLVLARRGFDVSVMVLPRAGMAVPLAWVTFPVLALAAASLVSTEGALARRGAWAACGAAALLVALADPALSAPLWLAPRVASVVAPACGAFAALALALLAADALEHAGSGARAAAAGALVACVASAWFAPQPLPALAHGDLDDELVAFDERPAAHADETLRVRGRIAEALAADALELRLAPSGNEGGLLIPLELAPAVDGQRAFDSGALDPSVLAPGAWEVEVRVLRDGADGERALLGSRLAGATFVPGPRPWLALFAATLALAALFAPARLRDFVPALVPLAFAAALTSAR